MLRELTVALFPLACPGCGAPGEAICSRCRATLRQPPPMPPPAGIDAWTAPFAYEGVAREVIARVKYRRSHGALGWLADVVTEAAAADGLWRGSVLTWAPTTGARRRARGFDHAAALAGAVGRRAGVPVRALLVREPGPPQTGRAAAARVLGPRFRASGVARRTLGRSGARSVVILDDVATTGATLAAAAAALAPLGAGPVLAVTAARTPGPA